MRFISYDLEREHYPVNLDLCYEIQTEKYEGDEKPLYEIRFHFSHDHRTWSFDTEEERNRVFNAICRKQDFSNLENEVTKNESDF
jgi:hypothetical protein